MAPMGAPRTYHSVAVLMSDGRIFSGGGGLCSQNEPPCAPASFAHLPLLLRAAVCMPAAADEAAAPACPAGQGRATLASGL